MASGSLSRAVMAGPLSPGYPADASCARDGADDSRGGHFPNAIVRWITDVDVAARIDCYAAGKADRRVYSRTAVASGPSDHAATGNCGDDSRERHPPNAGVA